MYGGNRVRSRNTWCVILILAASLASMAGVAASFSIPSSKSISSLESIKLIASDGAENDRFGGAVAISGDTALVGAPNADNSQGAVYVFSRNGEIWTEQAKLIASDGVTDDRFGEAVAFSGDTALVGASGAAGSQGAAYVFTRTDGIWTEQTKLAATNGALEDRFGASVALENDTAVVGAPSANGFQGTAYVFTRDGGVWSEQAEITAADGEPSDSFGQSVALSGDTVLVGANQDSVGHSYAEGAAYIFVRDGGGWSEQAKLTASDASQYASFGFSVALSGDIALVGSLGAEALQGAAYVFTRHEDNWSEQTKLTVPEAYPGSVFGFSVAVSDNTALVGIQHVVLGNSSPRGAVYVFSRTGGGWHRRAALTAFDGGTNDAFGYAVALSGDDVLAGAPQENTPGAAYVFTSDQNPAIAVHPQSLSPTVEQGQTQLEILDVTNHDGGALEWMVMEEGEVSLVDCRDAPGLAIHDDNTVEGGVGANAEVTSQVAYVDRFTPSTYPSSFSAACLSFARVQGTSLDFEIVIFDDDGVDGHPGTELGALPASALDIPSPYDEPVWFTYDISSLDLSIDSGSVYIGIRWVPIEPTPNVFLAADFSDDSPDRPPGFAGGYVWFDNVGTWQPIEESAEPYRSLFVRAVSPVDCSLPEWVTVDPFGGTVFGGESQSVDVLFDTAGLGAGTHGANLCLASNDPVEPVVVIPLSLTVEGPMPIADISPESFEFDAAQGAGVFDTLFVGNVGAADLDWTLTDVPRSGYGTGSHDPALDEPLELPDFEVDSFPNGGEPIVITVPAGITTHGQVVGFSFVGTASGITFMDSFASDTCMTIQAPDGATYDVGGFNDDVQGCDRNAWDFQGSGSNEDGTYESHHDNVFDPTVGDEGEWTFTFVNGWDSDSAATIAWSDVTITLHKAPLPICDDITDVAWLSASPDAGTTAPGNTDKVGILVDTEGLPIGKFEANLCVTTNDPNAAVVAVPIALTVTPGTPTDLIFKSGFDDAEVHNPSRQ